MQRIKCWLGFHDWRLFAFSQDPIRIIWRCERCAAEQLTPNTKAKRQAWDRAIDQANTTYQR